jgi:long-chain acyl-CoA synthetase
VLTSILRLPADPSAVTLPALLHRNAEDHPDLPALSWHADGAAEWTTQTWGQVRTRVLNLAAALAGIGVQHGDRVLLMMPNIAEHWLCDLALVHLGAVPVSVYGTAAPDQIRHIARHSGAEIAILHGPAEAGRWEPALADTASRVSRLFLVEPGTPYPRVADLERSGGDVAAVEAAWRGCSAEELLTVVYTSGTTGDPKGVAVTHRTIVTNALALDGATDLPDHVEHVCYLPFAHIAERMLGIYLPVFRAAHVYLRPDPAELGAVIRDVHPVQFFGVPRIWEKLAAAIQGGLQRLPAERQEAVAEANEIALKYLDALERGQTPEPEVSAAYAAASEQVLKPVLALGGLDRIERATSASAPMPPAVLRFWAGFGIQIMDAWGLTETMGVSTTNSPAAFRTGSVGKPTDGVQIRLAEDGEILVRSGFITTGYLRADGSVEGVCDAEGWFATGDVGRLDADGFLWLTDRKKEIIITSQGKNISPALVENALKAHPLIGQAMAYGDGRPYLVALLVLDPEAAARTPGLLDAEVAAAVEAANATLNRAEQVKRYRVLDHEWGPETGELTPSLKLKRRVVVQRYGREIDDLYQD